MSKHDCPCKIETLTAALPRMKIPRELDSLPAKAMIDLDDETLSVDRRFWRSLNADSKAALQYHEAAHLQNTCARYCDGKPKGCERCADERMGASLYLAGFPEIRAVNAVRGLDLQRATSLNDAVAGFRKAAQSGKKPNLILGVSSPAFAPTDLGAIQQAGSQQPINAVSAFPVAPPPPDKPAEERDGAAQDDEISTVDPAGALTSPNVAEITIPNPHSGADCPVCAYDCGWVAVAAGVGFVAIGLAYLVEGAQ